MASRALTDYIDVWIASKKSGVESAARYLTNVQSMNRDDVKVILQETTKTLGGFDTLVPEDGTAYRERGDTNALRVRSTCKRLV